MDAQDFIESIYSDGAGYATLVTKDAHGNPTVQKYFSYPDEITEMVEYANRFKNEDVYISPILFYEERRIRENAKSVAVVYADADTCPPEKFLLEPSISVETSPNRWHCYWVLDKSYDPTNIALLSKKVAYAHKEDGCDLSGWNPTKLLRVPGTSNKKYETIYPVVATTTGVIYTYDDVAKIYESIKVDAVLEPLQEEKPIETIAVLEVLRKVPNNTDIITLYTEEPPANSDMSKDYGN